MDVSVLLTQKVKLRPTETIVASLDGQILKEQNGVMKMVSKKSEGFVVDTSPDSIAYKIVDYVYLGSQDCVASDVYLHSLNVKNILCVAPQIPRLYPTQFNYKNCEILDLPSFDISAAISDCVEFIHNCVINKSTVVCHCNAGVSRSATIVIAYLMKHKDMSFTKAYDYVKVIRPCIRPNDGFKDYLFYVYSAKW
ncbi:dual specificity protein phosphatase, putative, partial [Entamoeba invadens IP1]